MTPTMTRSEAIAAADRILKQRAFTKEDRARADTLITYAMALPPDDGGAAMQSRALELAREFPPEPKQTPDDYKRAFRSYLAYGKHAPLRALQLLEQRRQEQRDMDSGAGAYPGSGSGYFVTTLFENQLWSILKAYDRLFDQDVVTWIPSTTGGPWALPNFDDTSASASIVDQNTQSPSNDFGAMSSVQFPACPTWRTGMIKASIELAQDSAFPLEAALARAFAIRFARGLGANFVASLMSSAVSSGQTVIGDDSQAVPDPSTQIGYADLLNLMEAVDPIYASAPSAGWVMNFKSLISLLGLRDKQNHPMLPTAHNDKGDFLIFERPVFICPSMANFGSGNQPIAYGDLKRFVCRNVTGALGVLRSDELYAASGQVGFQGYMRAQGTLVLNLNESPVGPYPVKYIQQP